MSTRMTLWQARRDLPDAGPEEDGTDDEGGIDAGPSYTCPGCYKNRSEPFHCTPCNANAEGPGYDD